MDADDQHDGTPEESAGERMAAGGEGVGDSAVLFDFLDAYYEDVAGGEVLPLERYLERFPGCEESITREFEAQETLRASKAPKSDPTVAQLPDDSQVGPYRLLSEIGRGGQGVVYLAEDTRIARRVALKVLPPAALLLSEDRRKRLQREAEVVSRLAHPGICGIFDAEIGRELAYIAMPVVEGRTLSSVIAERRDGIGAEDGPTTPIKVQPEDETELTRLLEFFEQAARALHSAHEAGVIHRDIKPGNLMVTPEGQPVWLDFGQARDAQSEMADLTLSGEVFGTPAYMSPEQVAGRPSDARTDVWALGVSLFEALTLRRPFEGASVHALLLAVQSDDTPDPRQLLPIIGGELAVVIETALERDLTRRYASALPLADDLARLLRHEPIQARPAGRILRARRWVQRHPVLAALILTISLSLAVMSYLLIEQVRITEVKDKNLSWAVGRHLADRSAALLAEDPAAALILGIEAVERAPNYLTREALFGALEACQLRMIYNAEDVSEDQNRFGSVALVPGGEYVAAVRFDGEARIYDLKTGERLQVWRAHAPSVDSRQAAGRSIACAANGRLIATGGSDGGVCIRDLATGSTTVEFEGPGGAVTELCFGTDDLTLAVRGVDGDLALHRITDGERVAILSKGGDRPIRFDARCGRFREYLRPGEQSAGLRQWFGSTGEPCDDALPPEDLRAFLGWMPTGWVGVGAEGSLVSGSPKHPTMGDRELLAPDERVLLARLSPGGGRIFLVTEAEGASGRSLRAQLIHLPVEGGPSSVVAGHLALAISDDGPPTEAVFSPTGDRLAVIGADSAVRLWNTTSGSLVATCRGLLRPRTLQWTADSSWFLTHGLNGTVARLWYGTERPDVYSLRCSNARVERVEFSPDGEHALTVSAGAVSLWSTPSAAAHGASVGALVRRVSRLGDPLSDNEIVRGLVQDGDPGSAVFGRFAHDGSQLLLWDKRRVQLWRVDPVEPEMDCDPEFAVVDVRLHPGHESIAVLGFEASSDSGSEGESVRGEVRLFSYGGEFLRRIESPDDGVQLVRYSPNGERLITAHSSFDLCCWDSATGEELWRVPYPGENTRTDSPVILDFAFHPDSTVVAVAYTDRRVRFFDVEKGSEPRKSLSVFPPSSIAWSADGRRILVTGRQGRGAIRIRDLAPPNPDYNVLRAEFFHADDITGGTFSPDGRLALSTSLDGTIMVRDVSGEEDARSEVLLAHLKGGRSAVIDACFSGGAGPLRVLAGFEDGTAWVWPVDPLPSALARRPRVALVGWKLAREKRLAWPLQYP